MRRKSETSGHWSSRRCITKENMGKKWSSRISLWEKLTLPLTLRKLASYLNLSNFLRGSEIKSKIKFLVFTITARSSLRAAWASFLRRSTKILSLMKRRSKKWQKFLWWKTRKMSQLTLLSGLVPSVRSSIWVMSEMSVNFVGMRGGPGMPQTGSLAGVSRAALLVGVTGIVKFVSLWITWGVSSAGAASRGGLHRLGDGSGNLVWRFLYYLGWLWGIVNIMNNL